MLGTWKVLAGKEGHCQRRGVSVRQQGTVWGGPESCPKVISQTLGIMIIATSRTVPKLRVAGVCRIMPSLFVAPKHTAVGGHKVQQTLDFYADW